LGGCEAKFHLPVYDNVKAYAWIAVAKQGLPFVRVHDARALRDPFEILWRNIAEERQVREKSLNLEIFGFHGEFARFSIRPLARIP
jgi:hypothetical protein